MKRTLPILRKKYYLTRNEENFQLLEFFHRNLILKKSEESAVIRNEKKETLVRKSR